MDNSSKAYVIENVDASKEEIVDFLYDCLKFRLTEPHTNISHTRLPSREEHESFVKGANQYHNWWVVRKIKTGELTGNAYVTHNGEIGIFVLREFRKQGVGAFVMEHIFKSYPSTRLLANIAPSNNNSANFFREYGFHIIQKTYALDR